MHVQLSQMQRYRQSMKLEARMKETNQNTIKIFIIPNNSAIENDFAVNSETSVVHDLVTILHRTNSLWATLSNSGVRTLAHVAKVI